MSHPQAKICGNDILPPAGVNANEVGFCTLGVSVSVFSKILTFIKVIDPVGLRRFCPNLPENVTHHIFLGIQLIVHYWPETKSRGRHNCALTC